MLGNNFAITRSFQRSLCGLMAYVLFFVSTHASMQLADSRILEICDSRSDSCYTLFINRRSANPFRPPQYFISIGHPLGEIRARPLRRKLLNLHPRGDTSLSKSFILPPPPFIVLKWIRSIYLARYHNPREPPEHLNRNRPFRRRTRPISNNIALSGRNAICPTTFRIAIHRSLSTLPQWN